MSSPFPLPLAENLLRFDRTICTALQNRRILVTGGTGFVGTWLLNTLLRNEREANLGLKVLVLSRDPSAFLAANPQLASWKSMQMLEGDVRGLDPSGIEVDLILHGATPASQHLNESSPLEMADIIIRGTQQVLNLAARCGAKRFLFLSSGLAYGTQSSQCTAVTEAMMGDLNSLDPKGAYGNAKHFAEHLCIQHGLAFGFEVCIARLFAFVGPLLPLDAHFAVGNFLRDGLAGRAIQVQGDGTPLRTYLYAGELSHWLWTLLAKGKPGEAYNVGSDEVVSIRELAEAVAIQCGVPVHVAGIPHAGRLPARYVPDIQKAGDLGLRPILNLEDSLRLTLAWHRRHMKKELS